eukprot:245799-Amphidinium_carterae.1
MTVENNTEACMEHASNFLAKEHVSSCFWKTQSMPKIVLATSLGPMFTLGWEVRNTLVSDLHVFDYDLQGFLHGHFSFASTYSALAPEPKSRRSQRSD